MIYVTDEALDALSELRAANNATEGEAILLYLEEDGSLGLALAELEEGDNAIERDGQVVVIVAEDLATALDGLTLDVAEIDDEVEFVIVDDVDADLADLNGGGGISLN